MARARQEINPKSAERLKQLYQEHEITQFWLSEKTGISQNTLSRIANGKTALSYAVACEIVKVIPDVSTDWLMGSSDFKNKMYETAFPLVKSMRFKRIGERAVLDFLKAYGIVIELNEEITPELNGISVEKFMDMPENKQEGLFSKAIEGFESDKAYVIKTDNGEIIKYISDEQRKHFIQDIVDYVDFKFDKLTESY